MKKIESIFPLVILFISLAFTAIFYQDAFINPNSVIFSAKGDGIKNAFTLASHAKEPSIIHYSKMNYPYGESMFYLDCHPVLATIIKGVSKVFPGVLEYSVGIMNFLMLFSSALTALIIYLIIIRFGTSKLFAIAGALGIAMLQPQIVRLSGHYALSYSVAIPLTWYLFMIFQESRHPLKWSIILCINNLFWFFIHAYLGMIVTAFIFIIMLADIIIYPSNKSSRDNPGANPEKGSRLTRFISLTIQSLAPIVIFYLTIKLTDIHEGRSDRPFGLLYYVADLESVFLPNSPPLNHFFNQIFKIETNWEGRSYIGLGTVVILILIIFNNLLKLFRLRLVNDRQIILNRQLITAFISSFILLLLSMGYPFKVGLEFLLDWVPILNNFRGIGRFSWPFFFWATCVAIIYAGVLIRKSRYKIPVYFLLLAIPASYIVEGFHFQKNSLSKLPISANYFSKENLPLAYQQALRLIDTSQYQAILPLPYYNVGCEEYKLHATNNITLMSMTLSYHSGIPLLATYATNTSMQESKNLMQVLTPNFYPKEITKDIKSRKPFLIAYSGETIGLYESEVLSKGTKIYQSGDFQLFSISYDDLMSNKANEYITHFENIRERFSLKEGFLVSSDHENSYFTYVSFDDITSRVTYYGKGALNQKIVKYNLIASGDPTRMTASKEYIASFWLYTNAKEVNRDLLRSLIFVQSKSTSGKIDWISSTNPAKSLVINGSWALIELPFKMPADCAELTVYLYLGEKSEETFTADEFLIYEKGVDIYKVLEESGDKITLLFKNNHYIRSI